MADYTTDIVDIFVEPLPGHFREEVLFVLKKAQSPRVELLADGVFSVSVVRSALPVLESVGYVWRPAHKLPLAVKSSVV